MNKFLSKEQFDVQKLQNDFENLNKNFSDEDFDIADSEILHKFWAGKEFLREVRNIDINNVE